MGHKCSEKLKAQCAMLKFKVQNVFKNFELCVLVLRFTPCALRFLREACSVAEHDSIPTCLTVGRNLTKKGGCR